MIVKYGMYYFKGFIANRNDSSYVLHAGVRANAERQIAEICAFNIARFSSDKYRKINRSSLAHLFVSFLEKVFIPVMFFLLIFAGNAKCSLDESRMLLYSLMFL